jgi:thiol:disulfide interchange protein DsbD
VADGYYLYRHRFKFAADGISFGEPALPPASPRRTTPSASRDLPRRAGVQLPISAGQPPFTLQLTSQGCADIGICYPPQVHALDVSGGGTVGSLLGRALGRSEAPAASPRRRRPATSTTNPAASNACWAAAPRSPRWPASSASACCWPSRPACSR